MDTLIPTPKLVCSVEGMLRFPEGTPVPIRASGSDGEFARDWLAGCLTKHFQVATTPSHDGRGKAICIGLLDQLTALGLADEGWRSSPAFGTPLGREQGYVLDVSGDAAVIAALGQEGLQNGAATLLQLLRLEEGALVAPCCRIEDRPDFRFRAAADWLLNVEINRWGYERGDGREALVARMKRKIDLAARYKSNVIWFDGFGWRTERVPGYAEFARELSDYARERHIRMVQAGYGGGYGFAYQRSQLYNARYQGQVFENRTSYPDGEVYDCAGLPNHEVSRRYGTCLSNAALAELKLAELTQFVRESRPGMLYIHDIDSGSFGGAHAGWKARCPQCRERWPDDEMVSEQGAAAAYGSWFRKVAEAINAIESEDGQYVAARDCEILFVGPMYTVYRESDDIWSQSCDYLALVSQNIGPFPNVEFGIREQFVLEGSSDLRVPMLKSRLDEVGNGHGVCVVSFMGGDNYYNSQLVSASAAFQRYYVGADTVYTVTVGSLIEPAQLLSAQCAWNSTAPGAFDILPNRTDMLELIEGCRSGVEVNSEVFGDSGLLSHACDRLYGPEAGARLVELLSVGLGGGLFPLAVAWRNVTAEVGKLLDSSADEAGERSAYWKQREELTASAIECATSALAAPLPDEDVRGDIEWLRTCLEVGLRLCRALGASWVWRSAKTEEAEAELTAAIDGLERFLDTEVGTDITDPVGGDMFAWRETAKKLRTLGQND